MTVETVVGLQEIAELLEVNRRTPHAWQYRRLLPPPDYNSINGLKAWDRATIIEWAARTGRLPESLRKEATAEVHIPRGGRRAKAENLAALAEAGLIEETDSTDDSTDEPVATTSAPAPQPTPQPTQVAAVNPTSRQQIGPKW